MSVLGIQAGSLVSLICSYWMEIYTFNYSHIYYYFLYLIELYSYENNGGK